MQSLFIISAIFTVIGALAAMTFRDSIHCILSLTVSFVGIAGLYIALGAQFVGFTQVLVYVGAVAVLAVFAFMMTPGKTPQRTLESRFSHLPGYTVAAFVFAVFGDVILHSHLLTWNASVLATASVDQIGMSLLHAFSVPLEVIGVLLTAALIGAVIVALPVSTEKL